MIIEGESLLPSPALTVPSTARLSNQHQEPAEVSMFFIDIAEIGESSQKAEDTEMSLSSETGNLARPSILIR